MEDSIPEYPGDQTTRGRCIPGDPHHDLMDAIYEAAVWVGETIRLHGDRWWVAQ
jgi:hypothetical protein